MMDILIAILLGIIEGIIEFLPISSSAHITLVAKILGLKEQEIELYAVVTQMGAVLAIVWHFRHEIGGLFIKKLAPQGSFLGTQGILICSIATLPAIFLGVALKPLFIYIFAPWSVSFFLFIGALFILWVENIIRNKTPICMSLQEITYVQAFYVGLFQSLSLFSGFSRSTATIMGALLIGFSRPVAVRFSFILAIPIMLGATVLKSITMWQELFIHIQDISISCIVACITSLLCIQHILTFLEHTSFIPFAIYRILLSVILFAVII